MQYDNECMLLAILFLLPACTPPVTRVQSLFECPHPVSLKQAEVAGLTHYREDALLLGYQTEDGADYLYQFEDRNPGAISVNVVIRRLYPTFNAAALHKLMTDQGLKLSSLDTLDARLWKFKLTNEDNCMFECSCETELSAELNCFYAF